MPAEIKTLVIDDRESEADFIRDFLQEMKSQFAFRVAWEADPRRALGRLAAEPFDLVLLDYQMPGINGLDVLRELRETHRALPVIMLTGQGNEAIAVEAMKCGAHDYLRKDHLSLPALSCAIMSVLERKRLEDELAERRRALDLDLRMARELQQAFLPQSLPHFSPEQAPDAMGLRFYHRYTPTFAIGGDFFDVLPISNKAMGIFLSDVVGHGLQAALVTAVLRTLIEELKDDAGEPDIFLQNLNDGLHRILRQMTTPVFASAFYLKLDMDAKRGSFCNAGHPPQLHLRRKLGEVARLFDASKTGPVLGFQEDAVFPAHGFQIDDEDVFLLFTDGIIDVPNASGEPFGLARLEAAAKKALKSPPPKLIDHINDDATQHAGATVFPDDVCLVAIEASSFLVRAAR